MRVQMVWFYYPFYLHSFYARNPQVEPMDYAEHRSTLLADHFAWAGDLARYLNREGIETDFVVRNDERLQKKWAREAGFNSYPVGEWERAIVFEQVRRFRPDFLWLSYGSEYGGAFIRSLLPYVGKAGLWMGSPFQREVDVDGFSVLLTENPATLRSQQHRFEKVIVTTPGFDPEILRSLGTVSKEYEITFVGQVSPRHRWRAELLAFLLEHGVAVRVRGFVSRGLLPGPREVAASFFRRLVRAEAGLAVRNFVEARWSKSYNRHVQTIRKSLLPPLFGVEMYRELARSRIVFNCHIDVAGRHAGNMRLFEATGVGACLLTEAADNLDDLFAVDREVLVYRTKEELLERIHATLAEPGAAERIARAGQKRTLQDHTLARMLERIRPLLSTG
ncbi:MAG: glycosyltransferase family protein [Kiritimatiellia bacterium]